MNLRSFLLLPAALLATAACSSSPDLSPDAAIYAHEGGAGDGPVDMGTVVDTAAMNCGDPYQPVDPTALIDDMESGGDPLIPTVSGRNGSWWAGGDMQSPHTTISPNGGAPSAVIPGGGRCGSQRAMRVSISQPGFTAWAVLTVSMRYGADGDGGMGLLPYNASFRNGVTFWARVSDTSAADVFFAVSDKYSRPEGGICDATVSNGVTACYDTFGVPLTKLGTVWTQYRIPFLGLTQRNFGLPRQSLDTSSIYTIDFNFGVGEIVDFWVDDIAFY
jgi:hypothetical protein